MSERSEVRAGIFVLVSLLILAAGTLWIVGFSPMRGKQLDFEVALESSGGVQRGDRIRVSGMEVGRIKDMELLAGQEWPVVLTVTVNERVALTQGATARITADGLLGAPYLEIVAGPEDGEPLAPGSRIYGAGGGTITETLEGLGESTDRLPVLLEETTALVGEMRGTIESLGQRLDVLLSEENVDNLTGALATLQPTLEQIGPQLASMVSRLDSLAVSLDEGLERVPEITDEMNGLVVDLRSAMGPDGERLAGVLDSAQETISTADGALSVVGDNRQELDAMLRDLREAAANLRSLSQMLKERPSLLLRSSKKDSKRTGEEGKP